MGTHRQTAIFKKIFPLISEYLVLRVVYKYSVGLFVLNKKLNNYEPIKKEATEKEYTKLEFSEHFRVILFA